MKNNKGFSVIAIVVILAVLVVGGYAVWQKQTTTSPSALPEGEGTEDWKTYRNDEYGFEFKYPVDFNNPHIPSDRRCIEGCPPLVNFYPTDANKNRINEEWEFYVNQPEEYYPQNYNQDNDKMSSINSQIVTIRDFESGRWFGFINDKTNKIFVLGLSTGGYGGTNQPQEKIARAQEEIVRLKDLLNQIASTFRFIKSDSPVQTPDISNWKTFKNKDSGYEITVPSGWTEHMSSMGPMYYSGDLQKMGGLRIVIYFQPLDSGFDIEKWKKDSLVNYESKEITTAMFNGVQVWQLVGVANRSLPEGVSKLYDKNLAGIFNKKSFFIKVSSANQQDLILADQILSTFRFVK
ncbi:MAG: hypothetical protein V1704_00915 [Candidatus Vogelbacteria bacterium]